MYLLTKISITIILILYLIIIIQLIKSPSIKKWKLLIIHIIQCSLLISIALTLNDIVREFL